MLGAALVQMPSTMCLGAGILLSIRSNVCEALYNVFLIWGPYKSRKDSQLSA